MSPFLEMAAISKRFPGVTALDGIDLELHAGEIVALVGENGAGKSTLMKILAGVHRADSGVVRIDGNTVTIHGPGDAARFGIGVIHQDLELIETLDAAANIFLGREPLRGGPLRLLDRRAMDVEAGHQLRRIGADIPPRTLVRRQSMAQRQLVAIARALAMNARLLIFDEPTSSLTSSDAERLFRVLNDLRAEGTAIIYISHRLAEVERIADRVVVLRDGRHAGTLRRDELTRDRIVQLMAGRPFAYIPTRPAGPPGAARLRLDAVRTARYPTAAVSLAAHRGEVLGIAGLVGAGRTELAEAICGIGGKLSGRVLLDDQPVAIDSPRDAIRLGLCLVPEDRRGRGVIAMMSVRDNVTLPSVASHARFGLVQRAAEARTTQNAITTLRIKAPSIATPVAVLSGGNQQKVVLGKWLALQPRVMIFDEPTQGVDVGAKAEIHKLVRRLADNGAAVLMISSDMEELVAESDRIAVMHQGRIAGILERDSCTPESIMRLAIA
jgi:ribose transport system ATP-binding protein